jgi:hypothetical protein
MERVKRDALLWTQAGVPGGATYLNNMTGTWFKPDPGAAALQESWAATAFGRDTRVNEDMHFCVNMQNQEVHQLAGLTNAARVNLVVFWHRSSRGNAEVVDRSVGPVSASDGCATTLENATANARGMLREIYMSTVVHWVAP